jgi:OOP family OmpA-OmpF porin
MRNAVLLAAFCGLVASSQAVRAESLTDEEILERFLIQRDAYNAVKTGKGKTRGLEIVSVEDLGGAEGTAPEGTAVADSTTEATETGTETGPVVASTDGPELGDSTTDDSSGVTLTEAEVDPVNSGDNPDLILAANPDSPIDPTQVGILPEELQVNVRITFDYDSATIKSDQLPVLEQMCRVITASDIKLFRIMGHTDSAGTDEYNEELSLLRAEEVKRRLVSDCGIEATRLQAMGLGERFLYDEADPKAAENRRVEFQAMS